MSTSPLKSKNVRFCPKSSPTHTRSNSLPHLRVPPSSSNHHHHKTVRLCHDQSSNNISKIDDSTFEGQLKRMIENMISPYK